LIRYMILVVLAGYMLCIGLAPLNKMGEFERQFAADSVYFSQYSGMIEDPGLKELFRDIYYREALLELAGNDSIQLVVNLADSAVCLMIKGLMVHEAPVPRFRIDKYLHKMPNSHYAVAFSDPLRILEQHSTIVKEPVVVRHAPGDPEEAALNAYFPDTLIQKPAFLEFSLDHGIRLVMEQEMNPSFLDRLVRFGFRTSCTTRRSLHSIADFFAFRRQEYTPEVIIRVPVNDLRAIYRALPDSAFAVIHFRSP